MIPPPTTSVKFPRRFVICQTETRILWQPTGDRHNNDSHANRTQQQILGGSCQSQAQSSKETQPIFLSCVVINYKPFSTKLLSVIFSNTHKTESQEDLSVSFQLFWRISHTWSKHCRFLHVVVRQLSAMLSLYAHIPVAFWKPEVTRHSVICRRYVSPFFSIRTHKRLILRAVCTGIPRRCLNRKLRLLFPLSVRQQSASSDDRTFHAEQFNTVTSSASM